MRFLILAALLCTSCASHSPISGGNNPSFIWPVRGGKITQSFKNSSRKHDGLDIAAKKNTPILAAASGKVIYTGRDFSGYGKMIIIEHQGDRWATFYAHLNGFKVREGQSVYRGQQIGYMGKTGRASGVHLHFEIRYNLRPVDPANFLGPRNYLTLRQY